MRTGFHHFAQLQNTLLTGWSWSRSGSNFVTRWWHLSKSAIFFGNQWTRKRAERPITAVLVLLLMHIDVRCSYIWLPWWFLHPLRFSSGSRWGCWRLTGAIRSGRSTPGPPRCPWASGMVVSPDGECLLQKSNKMFDATPPACQVY